MAFAAPLIPYVMAAGAVYQGAQQKNAADYNSKIMQNEATVSAAQGNEQTNTQLRAGNMFLGRSTAAAVESGGGVEGSTGAVLHQSAVNADMDALNVRYASLLRSSSYRDQASIYSQEGKDAMASSLISGAGGILRQKYGQSLGQYTPGGAY